MTEQPLPGDDDAIQDADEVPDPANDEVTDQDTTPEEPAPEDDDGEQ
jgi:hypothetical protein